VRLSSGGKEWAGPYAAELLQGNELADFDPVAAAFAVLDPQAGGGARRPAPAIKLPYLIPSGVI